MSPSSQSRPATRLVSSVLLLPHSFDRFCTFERSDSPAKLSEPAETERRRVTLAHLHTPIRNSPFSPVPFRPYTIIRAKSHHPKGVPRPHHPWLLHRRPVADQRNPRRQLSAPPWLFGCRPSPHRAFCRSRPLLDDYPFHTAHRG